MPAEPSAVNPVGVEAPLTLLIVHRNQPARCLATEAAFLEQGVALRLIVLDNGSTPSALEQLRQGLQAAELVTLDANLGFGPAANAGLARWLAEGERAGPWVALAPHDALPEPRCLAALLAAARTRPRAGLASAEFGVAERPVVDRYFGGITLPAPRTTGWADADYPHGTLLVASRACLSDIGLFDERYFAYCEEADLGVRARQAGWGVGIVWGAVVRNPSWSAAPVAEYLQLRNSLLLIRTHFGRYPVTIRMLMAVWQAASAWLRPSRRPDEFNLAGRALALRDFVRGRFGPPPDSLLPDVVSTATI